MQFALTGLSALAVMLATPACVHPYEQPSPKEPHAVVKVRVAYHAWPGPSLDEAVSIGEYRVAMPAEDPLRRTPVVKAIRVRPEPVAWEISTGFYHTYTTTSLQSYTYSCGKSMCTGTRTVTQTHRVNDGSCSASYPQAPEVGAMYLLQYDFYGDDQCSLLCLKQQASSEGGFRSIPCKRAAVPEED